MSNPDVIVIGGGVSGLSVAWRLAQAGSAEIAGMVRSRGIAVDRFAGGHGGVVTWAEVQQAAARP